MPWVIMKFCPSCHCPSSDCRPHIQGKVSLFTCSAPFQENNHDLFEKAQYVQCSNIYKFFDIRIFGISLLKCKANKAKEHIKHVST